VDQGIAGTLTVVVTALVMSWLARSRRSAPGQVERVLRYPAGYLILGLVTGPPFLVCAALSFRAKTGGPLVAASFVLISSLGVYVALAAAITRFRVAPEGIEFRSLFQGRGLVRWHEVQQVTWSPALKWFVLRRLEGGPLRISAGLRGLTPFAGELLSRVAPERFTAAALVLMQQTAAGNPPPIYD
jgi:hypothetical protein